MRVLPLTSLLCPIDGEPLKESVNTLVCTHKHSFDRAKEGYVNLLPVQDKASLDPGDSKEMVAARHRFLETGAYAPIATAVADLTLELFAGAKATSGFTILDAGCGEGYYLQQLAAALAANASDATAKLAGIDISKWAVRAAAKRSIPAAWAVASNRRPPFSPASVDLVLCLFGFPIWPGFAVIQPIGAYTLLVDPGPDHLLEMREIIYPEVRRAEAAAIVAPAGYVALSERRVRATACLPTADIIADLLSMTPHAHRATAAGRAALAAHASLDVTIDVVLRVFTRDLS